MMLLVLSIVAFVLAAIQAGLFIRNLSLFVVPFEPADRPRDQIESVSVLIPARDEEAGIDRSLQSILAGEAVELEVIVLDDHSTDATAEKVNQIAELDSRVRLIRSDPLPPTWNGKQHACAQLAKAASHERLVFLDADVCLQPHAISQLIAYQDQGGVDLLSAFPRQITGTVMEKILIPMMHYLLLCFLPMARMRKSLHPAYAAGCGQLFMTTRSAYIQGRDACGDLFFTPRRIETSQSVSQRRINDRCDRRQQPCPMPHVLVGGPSPSWIAEECGRRDCQREADRSLLGMVAGRFGIAVRLACVRLFFRAIAWHHGRGDVVDRCDRTVAPSTCDRGDQISPIMAGRFLA